MSLKFPFAKHIKLCSLTPNSHPLSCRNPFIPFLFNAMQNAIKDVWVPLVVSSRISRAWSLEKVGGGARETQSPFRPMMVVVELCEWLRQLDCCLKRV